MVRSTAKELRDLRELVMARDPVCRWPGCVDPSEQLAHLEHRGMGGSRKANTPDNTVGLCVRHHDCLDGRTGLGTLRWELNQMMRHVIRSI